MYDIRGSYDDGFYLMGAFIAASGLMLFAIPCLQRRHHTHTVAEDIIEQHDIDLGKKAVGSTEYLAVPQENAAENC
jgi:hypothetical protein